MSELEIQALEHAIELLEEHALAELERFERLRSRPARPGAGASRRRAIASAGAATVRAAFDAQALARMLERKRAGIE